MSDEQLSPQQQQERYEARLARLQGRIEALPEAWRTFAKGWQPCVRLCGRSGPGGSALGFVEAFVADLETLYLSTLPPPPALGGQVADHTSRGRF